MVQNANPLADTQGQTLDLAIRLWKLSWRTQATHEEVAGLLSKMVSRLPARLMPAYMEATKGEPCD